MGKIHELAAILADQIAAGEVVERPASVVKELIENALDAHSTQIDILVEESGLKRIQVTDNGDGIAPEDVELAFKRHSTSKITTKKDLFKIKTLGFRGEALPSIASVADVLLETATATPPSTIIHIKGGQLVSKKIGARAQGTQIVVSDLFFNTPARLKYLKSMQTELAAISDIVNRLALSHTEVAFSFQSNGRLLLETAGNGKLQQTFSAIYGVKVAREMIPISGADLDFEVSGYVSLPALTRASKTYISLLLNGRYIRNYQLSNAVIKGYGSKLMVGRYPFAVINLKLDPLLVDVNVHPTKQQVRISKEDQLAQLLRKTIYTRIAQENLIPNALENVGRREKSKLELDQLEIDLNESSQNYQAHKKQSANFPQNEKQYSRTFKKNAAAEEEKPQAEEQQPGLFVVQQRADLETKLRAWDKKYFPKMDSTAAADSDQETVPVQPPKKRFPMLSYLGQMHGTYLFAEAEDGLYIIDQHAAQERCNYEFYRKKIGEVEDAQQDLLVPLVLDYSTSEVLMINQNLDKLRKVGIYLEEFGRNSYIVRHHPTWFKAGQEEAILKEMIDYLLKDGNLSVAQYREKTAIMMSCKRAIKANHHLDERQARALLQQLARCENPFNCPHGRPVLVHFSNADMEKMFKRIQDSHHSLREQ
ncbi:DNA mismatch repair endonuclease MutL [Liquorilactobacillus satsumensis]|uniref:DNA mismatch repair endonuclease MutL n=1 Tax=Liquorilactobacillus satsumensis TaxID=259059 RepID=UPI0021C3AAA3|nr:DNA mismatch repair endonuclease MutL [Liquorilactobacillus satsumensis]MCP9312670.1 DNA mismatch repair endonuclease MutL [Liquorilactobacillus satsumensis]MCP9359856.1 DNA mismatch repair endonuclease MutL [Liquorilactobacillus satsumensis]